MAKRNYRKNKEVEYAPELVVRPEPAPVIVEQGLPRFIVRAQADGTGAWQVHYDGARKETAEEILANFRKQGIKVELQTE